eukprot:4538934-Amphidinium_carterae.1
MFGMPLPHTFAGTLFCDYFCSIDAECEYSCAERGASLASGSADAKVLSGGQGSGALAGFCSNQEQRGFRGS